MAIELFDNFTASGTSVTLTAGVSSTATVLPVSQSASTNLQVSGGQFRVLIVNPNDGTSEIALVTGNASTTNWTVQRGIESSPLSFPSGSSVKHILTRASLLSLSSSGGSTTVAGIFNVTDPTYGAIGNGTTDDTAAIQAAINAAHAAGGGTVYVPPSTAGYRIATGLTLYAHITFKGDGPKVSFLLFDDVTTYGITVSGSVVRTDNLTANFGPDQRIASISSVALSNYSVGDDVLFRDSSISLQGDANSLVWYSAVALTALPTAGQFMTEAQIPAPLLSSQTARVSKLAPLIGVTIQDLGLVVTGVPGNAQHRKCAIQAAYTRDMTVRNVHIVNFCNDALTSGNPLFVSYSIGFRISDVLFDHCLDVRTSTVNSNTRSLDVYGCTDMQITDCRANRISGFVGLSQCCYVIIDGCHGSGTGAPQVNPPTISAALATGGTLTVATTYYYKVTSTNKFGETTASNEVSATPTTGNQTVQVSWTIRGANAWENAEGYNIYRGTSPGGENVLVGTSLSESTGFTDNGIAGSAGTPPTIDTTGAPTDSWGNRGIKLYTGNWYCRVSNNVVHDFSFTGIRLHDSSYCQIIGNIIYGIEDDGLVESTSDGNTAQYSTNNIFAHNTIRNIWGGAQLGQGRAGYFFGRYTHVSHNQCIDCNVVNGGVIELFGINQRCIGNTIRNPGALANAIQIRGSNALVTLNSSYGVASGVKALDSTGGAGGNVITNNFFDQPINLHAGDSTGAPFANMVDAMSTFGATGNGTTDDTAAIQAAVNAANGSGGGIVYLGAGTFRIATSITMRANVELQGAGMGTTILLFDDVATPGIVTTTVTPSATTALTADLNEYAATAALTSGTGFAAGNTVMFTATGAASAGTWITRAGSVAGTTLTMEEPSPVSMLTSQSVQAQSVALQRNITLRDFTMKAAGTTTRVQLSYIQYVEDCLIEHVEFNTSGGTGLEIVTGRNVTVRGCIADSFTSNYGVGLIGVTNGIVTGCQIRNSRTGILMTGCPHSAVTGNVVQGTVGATGYGVYVVSGSSYTSVAGNSIANFSAGGGVDVADSWAVSVNGNTIFNVGTGIQLSASLAGRIHHVAVAGNIIRKTTNSPGVIFNPFAAGDSTYTVIENNSFSDIFNYGVYLTTSFNRVTGNIFNGYANVGVIIPATGNPHDNVIGPNTYDNAAVGTTVNIAGTGLNTVMDGYWSDGSASVYVANATSVRNSPKVFALTDAATVTIPAHRGTNFTLSAGAGRTFAAPTAPASGMVITVDILNNTGGAITTTWNAVFKLAGAWTDPAATKRRTITFYYDGTNWVETTRVAADI